MFFFWGGGGGGVTLNHFLHIPIFKEISKEFLFLHHGYCTCILNKANTLY